MDYLYKASKQDCDCGKACNNPLNPLKGIFSNKSKFCLSCYSRNLILTNSKHTVKPLNSGHRRVLKNLPVIKRCPLLGGSLTKIVTFGTEHFVRYSRHVRYLGCSVLGSFTVVDFSFAKSYNFIPVRIYSLNCSWLHLLDIKHAISLTFTISVTPRLVFLFKIESYHYSAISSSVKKLKNIVN